MTTITAKPQPISMLLANPGMGWQTFHTFADSDPTLAGLPSSTCYFRWYWKELEPADGEVNFGLIDRTLERARRAGQQLAFRVMIAGTSRDHSYSPQWLEALGCAGYEYTYGQNKRVYWVPDLDDPLVLDRHLRLIGELGDRYDGHSDIALVDIGSVGLWGEWHFGSTHRMRTGERVPLPTLATRQRIVDAYLTAFKRTPLVMLIGDADLLAYATARGAGWRADCLGDLGGFSPTWNHMEHRYRQLLDQAGAHEAWRHGPVAWESCWDMRKWVQEGWDVRFIFDYALEFHGSYLNNKSQPLPEGSQYRHEVERLLLKLGYRFVLRSVAHPSTLLRGETARIILNWENAGVAPCYADYSPALRLVRAAGLTMPAASREGASHMVVLPTSATVRAWFPGPVQQIETITIPDSLEPGLYDLSVAVVRADGQPAVRLAIEGRGDDGWYRVSSVTIE